MSLTATHKVILALSVLGVLATGVYLSKVDARVLEMAVAAFLGWLAPSPVQKGS